MRSIVTLSVAVLLATSALPVGASDNKLPDMDSILALESRASQAEPRDQCFLYAQLVQQMTELSVRQYTEGDVGKATVLLKRVRQFAQKIYLTPAKNDKRIKNAEILLSHTIFRLTEMLHASSYEDRSLVQDTLADVSKAQQDTLFKVLKK